MSFKRLVDKENDKVKFFIIPKTNEEYISVPYGCIRIFDSYRFLFSSLDKLVKMLVDSNHKKLNILKERSIESGERIKIVNEIVQEVKTFKDF